MVCHRNEEDVAVLTQTERFAKAAAALKVRDAEDKKVYNERKRAKNQEKRAKQKLRDAEERGEEAIAILGPGLGFPGEEDLGNDNIFLRLGLSLHTTAKL